VGHTSPRDGTGVRVTVRAGGRLQAREAGTSGSYLSASDPRIHLGLEAAQAADSLTLHWPSGTVQTLQKVPAGQTLTLVETSPGRQAHSRNATASEEGEPPCDNPRAGRAEQPFDQEETRRPSLNIAADYHLARTE